MAWLLAACIPGLLMLATFGLERLETGLGGADSLAAAELAELIEQVRSTSSARPAAATVNGPSPAHRG